jgi:hypothetical protein
MAPRCATVVLLLATCVGTCGRDGARPATAPARAGALRLRGGYAAGLDYTDRATRQLEKKLGGRDRARRALVNHGYGGLLDDLDDIAQAIARPGVRLGAGAPPLRTGQRCPAARSSKWEAVDAPSLHVLKPAETARAAVLTRGKCAVTGAPCAGVDTDVAASDGPLAGLRDSRRARPSGAGARTQGGGSAEDGGDGSEEVVDASRLKPLKRLPAGSARTFAWSVGACLSACGSSPVWQLADTLSSSQPSLNHDPDSWRAQRWRGG